MLLIVGQTSMTFQAHCLIYHQQLPIFCIHLSLKKSYPTVWYYSPSRRRVGINHYTADDHYLARESSNYIDSRSQG